MHQKRQMVPVANRLAAFPSALHAWLLLTLLSLAACSGSTQGSGDPGSATTDDGGVPDAEAGEEAESGFTDTPVTQPPDAFDAALDPAMEPGMGPDSTATCKSTPANILGPYYKPGAPERNVLVEPADPGVRLTITGRVLSSKCAPVGEALLDVWHADAAGEYDMVGFKFRGRFHATASGAWQLDTIVPGRYLNGGTYRPAHIHVKVDAPGMAPLTTQLYFDDDPFNANDGFILPELIMHVEGPPEGPRTASFDFVLQSI